MFVVVLICSLAIAASHILKHTRHNETTVQRRLQFQHGRVAYDKPAMEFLKEYGRAYHLFDQFFYSGGQNLSGRIEQTSTSPRPTESIAGKYKTLDYDTFTTWGIATATVRPEYASLKFDYQPRASNDEVMMYNNKYRYGPSIDDRFMWIGFDRDPFTEGTAEAPVNIFFVGVNTQLPETHEYRCVFHALQGQFNSTVIVTRQVPDVLQRPTLNSIVKCSVPHALVQGVVLDKDHIVLDLVRTPVHSPGVAVASEWMLSDIHVPRLHALNRRRFKHTIQTMVEVLNDVMVCEWLVYNILLGFEHFYIYYNAKGTDFDIEHTILRPFLDANIVTLIYFPFLHTVHYNNVQHAALNIFHRAYGHYVDWVGYWDVDEFFLPGATFVPYLLNPAQPYTVPIVPLITAKLGNWNEPAIMFDTLDMDCAVGSANYYVGGDNIALMPGSRNSTSGGSASADAGREAVTTHCTRTGYLFHEMQAGHGKMLVCPARVEYVASPHRFNNYWTRWTDANDGLMRHFNRFRNTMLASGFTADKVGTDLSLQTFAVASLKALLGITFVAR